jgi:hypothetical protein
MLPTLSGWAILLAMVITALIGTNWRRNGDSFCVPDLFDLIWAGFTTGSTQGQEAVDSVLHRAAK